MPRRPNPDLWVHWKLTLPATLAGKIAFLFHDPSTNKIKYGARNALVAELLEGWLAARETVQTPDCGQEVEKTRAPS